MRTRAIVCAAAGVVLIAQTPSIAATDDTTALSGLTVMARRASPVAGIDVNAKQCLAALDPADAERKPPKLVSSYPSSGANVRPGILILRLTFDQPMTCDGVLQRDPRMPYPCPVPLRSPMMSRDRRTFLTVCKVDPSTGYSVVVDGFTSLAGHALKPYHLDFSANPLAEIKSVKEAIDQDRELRNPKPAKGG